MPDPNDRHNLQRFLDAQAVIYPQVHAELQAGQKRTHWMWFIFPQIRGLGSSPMAQQYALGSLAEARAFLDHPTLGQRLRDCTALVNTHAGRLSVDRIFGYPDDLKFRSSITLFTQAAPTEAVFAEALRLFFAGEPDPATLRLLRADPA